MTQASSKAVPHSSVEPVLSALVPVIVPVFLGFLAVSAPLAALAIEVRDRLGFGPSIVGWVVGLQSMATLVTRHGAGTLADRRGSRSAVLLGFPLSAASGLAYALAGSLPLAPGASLALLIAGRLIMGLGESLFLTGLMSWGMARVGRTRTGLMMSWTGIAIYAALGLGAPVGLVLQASFGFAGVGAFTVLAPLLAVILVYRLPSTPSTGGFRVPFHRVVGLIWRPGIVLALATVPFAAVAAFLALDYAAHGWPGAGAALFGFGAAYVVVRLAASDLADRIGATRVAIGSLAFEVLGQTLLWLAPTPLVAVVGATVTGLGFSLVFPAMGVLATRSVSPELRGRAVGNFIAFADLALAATGPLVGFATQGMGLPSAFLIGAIATGAALCALPCIRPGRAI